MAYYKFSENCTPTTVEKQAIPVNCTGDQAKVSLSKSDAINCEFKADGTFSGGGCELFQPQKTGANDNLTFGIQ